MTLSSRLLRYLLAATVIGSATGIGPSLFSTPVGPAGPAEAGEMRASVLKGYRVVIEAKPVPQLAANLSGLAYDRERRHLWAVVNNPEELLALDRNGELLARYPLEGFKDVEGIACLGDGRLVIAEERHNALVIIAAPDRPGALSRGDYGALKLPARGPDNGGLEGLGYDARNDRLFAVKERSPRELYEIRGLKASLEGRFDVEVIDRSDWVPGWPIAADLSSVEFDEVQSRLLLLSQESRMIAELDGDGQGLAIHRLTDPFAGLAAPVTQAEGVAFDEEGTLYIVSEPNLFYAFEPERSGFPRARGR